MNRKQKTQRLLKLNKDQKIRFKQAGVNEMIRQTAIAEAARLAEEAERLRLELLDVPTTDAEVW